MQIAVGFPACLNFPGAGIFSLLLLGIGSKRPEGGAGGEDIRMRKVAAGSVT